MLPGPLPGLVLHLECLREILTEVVGRPALQRLAVLHERLDAVGADRARELLAVALDSRVDRDRHLLLRETPVDLQDLQRLILGLRLGGVRRVSLLPEELRGAQEQSRAHLPADDVRPLVHQHRHVAVRSDPLGGHGVDDRLRSRPDDQRLFQLLAAAVSHHGELGRESGDVLGLLVQEGLRDEEREVGVLVPALLEARVELPLHRLPHRVPQRADHHAPLDRRVVRHLGLGDYVGVPAGVVVLPGCDDLRHALS